MRKMKKIIILIALSLILVESSLASSSIIYPLELQLKPGDTGRFNFGIKSDYAIHCRFSNEHKTNLIIRFDQDEGDIDNTKMFNGNVKVPENLIYGYYEESLCVFCEKINENVAGSVVKEENCGIPISVNVVEERTKENYYVAEKAINEKKDYLLYFAAIVLILTGVIVTLLYIKKKKSLYIN